MMNLDIIVLLVVVALIFQRLWKALGTRPDSEPQKIKLSREGAEKLYNLLCSETQKVLDKSDNNSDTSSEKPMSELDISLSKIPSFNSANFLSASKRAFQVIAHAFNMGEKETLESLVSSDIYKKMLKIINQRQKDKITAETEFICFDNAEIVKATIADKQAQISVKFVSEQINILRNDKGEVITGDENFVQTITDVWTFTKSLDPKVVNWLLTSTKKECLNA